MALGSTVRRGLLRINLCIFIVTALCTAEIEFIEQDRCKRILGSNSSLSREDLLHKLLICSAQYDPKIPPTYDQKHEYATNVTVQFHILSIYSIDETAMDFSVDMILRQSWMDPRLQYEHLGIEKLELDNKMMTHVWVPDTYFSNEKEADFHDVTVPNRLLFIYKNGTVRYSIRISMTLSCYMQMLTFPLDSQICPMKLESFSYTQKFLDLQWATLQPVFIPEYIGLPQFFLSDPPRNEECDNHYGTEEMYACLKTSLFLERNKAYYIIQIFVPSILIVALSWVSFWIDIEAVPARISLGLMAVLTMTTHSSGVRATLPKVSYVKAIDIWMATCITFVFGSLLEYAYINVLNRRMKPLSGPQSPTAVMFNEVVSPLLFYRNFRDRARKADKFSRVAFPVTFVAFNIFFWIFFLYVPVN